MCLAPPFPPWRLEQAINVASVWSDQSHNSHNSLVRSGKRGGGGIQYRTNQQLADGKSLKDKKTLVHTLKGKKHAQHKKAKNKRRKNSSHLLTDTHPHTHTDTNLYAKCHHLDGARRLALRSVSVSSPATAGETTTIVNVVPVP